MRFFSYLAAFLVIVLVIFGFIYLLGSSYRTFDENGRSIEHLDFSKFNMKEGIKSTLSLICFLDVLFILWLVYTFVGVNYLGRLLFYPILFLIIIIVIMGEIVENERIAESNKLESSESSY
jgi:uncharacterized membrane protein